MQHPLLGADLDQDGIGFDFQTADAGAARVGGHFALFVDFEGLVIDDGQPVVGGAGNAIELQFDGDGGGAAGAGCWS